MKMAFMKSSRLPLFADEQLAFVDDACAQKNRPVNVLYKQTTALVSAQPSIRVVSAKLICGFMLVLVAQCVLADELQDRVALWESKALVCTTNPGLIAFPSKYTGDKPTLRRRRYDAL